MYYNIFMDYVPGGTLVDVIRAHGGRLSELKIGVYTRHILLGLNYLHSMGIVHCDIKGSNILMDPSGPKIADFGCAKRVSPVGLDKEAVAISGTPLYMAPEVVRGEEQGFPADIWSLGCIFVEMATGRPPWIGGGDGKSVDDPLSVVYKIAYSEEPLPEYSECCFSEEAMDFLSKCLRRDPEERWTASQLLDHCFVNKFDPYDHDGDHRKELISVILKTNCSPTSILDQGMWYESSCSIRTSSADQRVRELSLGCGLLDDWGFGVNWVVIRG